METPYTVSFGCGPTRVVDALCGCEAHSRYSSLKLIADNLSPCRPDRCAGGSAFIARPSVLPPGAPGALWRSLPHHQVPIHVYEAAERQCARNQWEPADPS